MATIKAYTDLQQSKKLAEFLPLESADGFWNYHDYWYSEGDEWEGYKDYPRAEPYLEYTRKENEWKEDKSDVPCWSLAALLEQLKAEIQLENKQILFLHINKYDDINYEIRYTNSWTGGVLIAEADNLVDACVDMIERLHELNLL